ncbi:hypothetical protein HZH68_000119 [Vespula germanica]|uniref:Uncharacterized protein n=1 Tax=Vespula germanica TaxID=30212 RepID=A0A834U5J4_VESGE|nr:hypothetical protein HZH68_000119 [Vespula germanica]
MNVCDRLYADITITLVNDNTKRSTIRDQPRTAPKRLVKWRHINQYSLVGAFQHVPSDATFCHVPSQLRE